MSAITGLVGLGGGAAGTSFAGPQQAADQTGMQNQQDLIATLKQVATGQGPNAAQNQYFQNTQDLAKQQAGAMASVQGISPALSARLISQQGAAANQNAAAAGATNMANQQLGAMGQIGNIANSQANNAVGMQSNINSANAGLANTQMTGQQNMIGGAMNGVGAMFASGGEVDPSGPQSSFGRFLKGATATQPGAQAMPQQPALMTGASNFAQGLGRLFSPAPQSAGQALAASGPMAAPDAASSDLMFAAMGGMTHDYRSGGGVKAKESDQKAVKSGNSYANDKIPAVLSEGEVVIPRSVMQGKDPPRGAAQFVQAVLAKKKVTGRL